MKKGITFLPLVVIVLFVVMGVVVFLRLHNSSTSPKGQEEKIQPTKKQNQPTALVPLPTEEDIIRNFFNLINERRIPEAVNMMSKINVENDSTKQAWGVQFNAIKSINVQKIEKSMEENWTDNSHTYKVILEAYVSSEAAGAPIPYYGWADNPNIRWVQLVRENNLWRINGLATGP